LTQPALRDETLPMPGFTACPLTPDRWEDLVEVFGCTDCSCTAHLFYTAQPPNAAEFSALVNGAVEGDGTYCTPWL
jgi:hypothetical protein